MHVQCFGVWVVSGSVDIGTLLEFEGALQLVVPAFDCRFDVGFSARHYFTFLSFGFFALAEELDLRVAFARIAPADSFE